MYSCSSRSKTCPYCRKYIVLRDFEYHCETEHDDGIREGEKYFQGNNALAYNLDFSKKNPFLIDKIKNGVIAGRGSREEMIRPNEIPGDEEEIYACEKENNNNEKINGFQGCGTEDKKEEIKGLEEEKGEILEKKRIEIEEKMVQDDNTFGFRDLKNELQVENLKEKKIIREEEEKKFEIQHEFLKKEEKMVEIEENRKGWLVLKKKYRKKIKFREHSTF